MNTLDSKQIRWLHLSDFHIGKEGYPQDFILEKIIKHIEKKVTSGFIPDFVFITGDIANKGLRPEYEKFWEHFIAPLETIIPGLLDDKLFIVPGNHDLNRLKNEAFDRNLLLRTNAPFFDPKEDSLTRREMIITRFDEFIAHDLTGYSELFSKKEGAYSKKINIKGRNIGIVGINTAWLCRDENDYKHLTPGKPLIDEALSAVKDAELIITLGHHPTDWFSSDHFRPISALLGNHHALYLHGHMHGAWASPAYGAGNHFLNIQCGAAFQAHETDKWKNGLLWAEVDLDQQIVSLQAYQWNSVFQEWKSNDDAFPNDQLQNGYSTFLLPRKMNAVVRANIKTPGKILPGGWEIQSLESLKNNTDSLTLDEAVLFFNGSVPTWRTALSNSIPRRKIVSKAVSIFKNIAMSDKPIVGLISSAGCEGKSTSLLQTAYEIAKSTPNVQIIRRTNDSRPFSHLAMFDIVNNDKTWLIVMDEADQEAESILAFINNHIDNISGRVHFLLACRDSAWISSSAVNLKWSSVHFKQERLSGLTLSDAELIVNAWAAYGNDGLGALAETAPSRRATILKEYADQEVKKTAGNGALFGALLIVRHGEDLHEHARSLVDKLDTASINSELTLKDAITYIAIMHAIDHDYLCKDVLQEALNCDSGNFHASVVRPLGQEAAATATSTYIYTRHKYIAKEIIKVLTEDHAIDIQKHYITLVKSALSLMEKGVFIKDLESWRYKLPDYFMSIGDSHLAIKIVEEILSLYPDDTYTITHLASLYRSGSRQKNATDLFRNTTQDPKNNRRPFFFEWSVSEGYSDNLFESAVLSTYALSDDCEYLPIAVDRAIYQLNGISESFRKLHARFPDKEFMDAFHSACTLLLICHNHTKSPEISQSAHTYKSDLDRGLYSPTITTDAIENLKIAFKLCCSYVRTQSIMDSIGKISKVNFACLERMVNNISRKS